MVKRVVATFISMTISLTMLFSLSNCESVAEMRRCRKDLTAKMEHIISPYDDIMQLVGIETGLDWRLLSAIAHTESHFRANAVSSRGAIGLMQIMPYIGEHFGLTAEELENPYLNIRAAASLILEIDSMIKVPEHVSFEDTMSLILACYNGGLGHVADARRLARAYGANRNSWEDVSHYLTLKSEPEYYEHEVVRYGKFTGSRQTIAYVRNVMRRYHRYCTIADPMTIEDFCELQYPISSLQNLI